MNLDKYDFNRIDSAEKAYTLGVILAYGTIDDKSNVCVSVPMTDKAIAEFVSRVLSSPMSYSHMVNKKSSKYPSAYTSKRVGDITRFTGGIRKCDMHYPIVRSCLDRYLLLGVFDAHGALEFGIKKSNGKVWQKVYIDSGLRLLEGIQKYMSKRLGVSSIVRPKSGASRYILEISSKKDVLKFLNHIYPDENFIILHRKYSKYCALRRELGENGEGERIAQ